MLIFDLRAVGDEDEVAEQKYKQYIIDIINDFDE